jgi:NAD(P)-dependent dehydrogenase (short-subunit alcohol dehydrogenase family)
VVIGDVASTAPRSIAREITERRGPGPRPLCDVRREESVAPSSSWPSPSSGDRRLDHNAAWSHPRLDTDAGGVDLGVWERVLETNTRGALLLARHAIPVMIERGGGSIVNISSGTSTIGESTRVAYGVSKAAINQLTRHLATRYGRDGIRANAIAPGFHPHRDGGEPRCPKRPRCAWPRPTRPGARHPDDIARVVVFLCSDAPPTSTGRCSTSTAVTRSPG